MKKMNTGFVLSRHGSFQEILDKMGGDKSFMSELFVVRKYAEKSNHVFVFSHDSKDFSEMLPKNCSHIRFHSPFLYTLFGWMVILCYVLRHDVRILYVESVSGMLSVVFVNKLSRAVVMLDYLYLWHQPVEGRLKRALIRKIERFLICFADYFMAANSDIEAFIGDREKILPIGANSLYLGPFRNPRPDPAISRLSGKKIVFVGRLIKIKDPLTLMRAYIKVRKSYPAVHLIMCGDGELRHECESLADENVHFLGFAKDMPSILRASDIFVLPSLFDASPRALVEAMGTGLACIATKVGGVPGYLDEECGMLVRPGNEDELAQKLLSLLKNPVKAKRLGANARKKIFARYDLEKNTGKQLDFLMKKI
jgi:glycosyltransferase involved in cell wall biosynthesis